MNNLTLTFSANKVSNDQITFIVPYGMRIFILKYSISSNALLTNGGFVFRQVSSNSNDIEIFDTAFTDDYYVFLYENNTNKNNAIGMQSSTFSTGSIVSEVCNNSSRIKSNFIGTIYGSECGVFLNDTDITLWKWDGTKLVNKLVFIQTTYPYTYTKNIGNILSNITFQDMHIENLSEIFTLFQINNTND